MKTNFYGEIFGVYNNESKNDALSGFYLIINAFLPTNIHSCIHIYEIITRLKIERCYKEQDQEFFLQSPNNLVNLSQVNHAFLSHSSIIDPSYCKIAGVIIKENYYSIDENKICDIKQKFSFPFSAKTISPRKSRGEFKLHLEKIDGFYKNLLNFLFLNLYEVSTPIPNFFNVIAENPKETDTKEEISKNFNWDNKNYLENEENDKKSEKNLESNEDKKEIAHFKTFGENIEIKEQNIEIIEEKVDKKEESLDEIKENLNLNKNEENPDKIKENLDNPQAIFDKKEENAYTDREKEQDIAKKEMLASDKLEVNTLPPIILDSKKSESNEKGKINYFNFENLKVVTSITDFEKEKTTPTKNSFISKKTSLENMDLLNFPAAVSKRKSLFLQHEVPKTPKTNQLLEIKEINIKSMDLDESQNVTENNAKSKGYLINK